MVHYDFMVKDKNVYTVKQLYANIHISPQQKKTQNKSFIFLVKSKLYIFCRESVQEAQFAEKNMSAPNDEHIERKNRKKAQKYLLLEHLFNTLADRMWLYAAGLLLMEAISRMNPEISQITVSSMYGLILATVKVRVVKLRIRAYLGKFRKF